MMGTIHDKQSMILRITVGNAQDNDGNEYEMCTLVNQSPLIMSKKTGKYFSLSWVDILDMAKKAGIDEQ